MASKYNRKKLNKPPQDELWIWLPQSMMTSEALRKLRINSLRLLHFLMNEHMSEGGQANGRLVAPYKQLQEFGLSKRKISDAINQCERLGFIEVSRGGRIANKDKCSRYTLTWLPTLEDGKPASNKWRRVSKTIRDKQSGGPTSDPD